MTFNKYSLIKTAIFRWLLRIIMILISIIMLYPLIWNLYSAFKTNTEFLTDAFAPPSSLQWSNFARAIEQSNLLNNVGNSVLILIETLLIVLVCAVPCSYCLVRYNFKGAKTILNIYMACIFIQATVIMIPLFLQMNAMHLLNNRAALGVLYATMQFPFSIFLLSGFMRSIPKDYEEAAMLDGCGPFGVLHHVIVPMAKPGIITVSMISAMSCWNEFPVALVMLTDGKKQTLSLGIAQLFEIQKYSTDWGALFAALVLALIPTVVIFLICQRQLIQGMNVGGIKG